MTVQPDTPVEDAAKLLYTHHIGCLPVLEDDRLVGILTETGLLRAFAELFGARTPSTRVIAHQYGAANAYITFDEGSSLPHAGRHLILASYTIGERQVTSNNLRHEVLYHEASHLFNYPDQADGETGSAYDFADLCKAAETTEIDSDMDLRGGNDGKDDDQICYWIVWTWKHSGEYIRTDFLGCFG